MGRNRKDSEGLPIENYRKQIGKQDYKKSKKELKAVKKAAEARKSGLNIKDVILMLAVFVAMLGAVYALLYFSLSDPNSSS